MFLSDQALTVWKIDVGVRYVFPTDPDMPFQPGRNSQGTIYSPLMNFLFKVHTRVARARLSIDDVTFWKKFRIFNSQDILSCLQPKQSKRLSLCVSETSYSQLVVAWCLNLVLNQTAEGNLRPGLIDSTVDHSAYDDSISHHCANNATTN
jgi:hypothetical protein